jgi:hypothetical protein
LGAIDELLLLVEVIQTEHGFPTVPSVNGAIQSVLAMGKYDLMIAEHGSYAEHSRLGFAR